MEETPSRHARSPVGEPRRDAGRSDGDDIRSEAPPTWGEEPETGAADHEPADRPRPRRPALRRVPSLAIVALSAGLGAAGWFYADPLRGYLGLGAPSPETGAQTEARTPDGTDANVVTLDADGRKRLGLAFGTAEIRRIVKPVRAPGTVAFDERRVTHLKPRTQGRVLSLAVQPGDRVTAGETLATLDASGVLDARNGLASAQASLGEAQAGAKVAELQLKRGQDQLKFGGVAQAEVERRQVDLAKAQAAVQSAQAQADMYRAQYERLAPAAGPASGTSAILTPIAGVVTSANITLGEVVDTARDAFTVADPTRVLVLANLYPSDVDVVRAGDAARVDAPVAAHPHFEGHVRSVNAAMDAATGTAPARIEIDNPGDALRANMFVSVEIAADLGRDGLTIPAAAVQQSEGGPIAFVRGADDRFEKRDLTLGLQRADWVEVEAGVNPGETVVTAGSFGLKAILLRALLGSTD